MAEPTSPITGATSGGGTPMTGSISATGGTVSDRSSRVRQLGRYRIVKKIGVGGSAIVYEAVDTTIDKRVALKVLHEHLREDPVTIRRFVNDARALAKLNHSNIVQVFSAELDQFYFAMELVEGADLAKLIGANGGLPADRAIRICLQAAKALVHIHQMGFVHRDIKPGNILLGPDDTAKLTDFSIVHNTDETMLTLSGSLIGTMEYMSPEQIREEASDARADVYALGAVLHECLVGKPPFTRAEGSSEVWPVMERILKEPPVPPHDVVASVSEELSAIVLRALAKTPSDRFATMEEFADALRAELRMTAPPESAPTFTRAPRSSTVKKSRSRIIGLGIAGVVIVALGAAYVNRSQPAPTSLPTTPAPAATVPPTGNVSTANVRSPMMPQDGVITDFEDIRLGTDDRGINSLGGLMSGWGKADPISFTGPPDERSTVYSMKAVKNFNPQNVHSGAASYRVVWGRNSFRDTWASLGFDLGPEIDVTNAMRHRNAGKNISDFRYLSIWLMGAKGGEKYRFLFRDIHAPKYDPQAFYPAEAASLPDTKWHEIRVPLSEVKLVDLENLETMGLELSANIPGEGAIYVDDVKLIK